MYLEGKNSMPFVFFIEQFQTFLQHQLKSFKMSLNAIIRMSPIKNDNENYLIFISINYIILIIIQGVDKNYTIMF